MDRIERLAELRREVAPYPNSAACKVLHHLLTMMIEVLQEEQLTTAEPTPTVPTMGYRWGVADPTIPGGTRWLSDPVDTKSGPVEPNSVCVHEWKSNLEPSTELRLIGNGIRPIVSWCKKCGALMWLDKILAPDVQPILSTSVKQPSSPSVENSVEEYVKLPSNKLDEVWWPNGYKQIYGALAGQPWHWHSGHGHKGGEIWHEHAPKLDPDVRY